MTTLPQDSEQGSEPPPLRFTVLVPLVLFLAIAAVFMVRLLGPTDHSVLPDRKSVV